MTKTLLFIFFLSFAHHSQIFAEEKIQIGISSALSGPAANYGQDTANVIRFANEESGSRYDLVVEDDKCNAKEAASIAHNFVDAKKIKYVLGLPCSSTMLASAPIYENAEVIAITAVASSPAITSAGEYIFRTRPSDAGGAKEIFEYLKTHQKSPAILYEELDFPVGILNSLKEENKNGELRYIIESFLPDNLDVKAQILKLRSKGADSLVLLPQSDNELVIILKAFRESGWKVPVYAFSIAAGSAVRNLEYSLSDGLIYVGPTSPEDMLTPEGMEIYERFKERYGPMKGMDFVFISAYESFNALDQAIQNKEPVKDYLLKKKFHGIFGDYSFDSNGDIIGFGWLMHIYKSGKATTLN